MPKLRLLRKGDRGPDVKALQQGLNLRNKQEFGAGLMPDLKTAPPAIGEDGVFWNETDGAVRDFQARHGLDVDGKVGPLTRGALFHLGVATITVFGLRLNPPSAPAPVVNLNLPPDFLSRLPGLSYSPTRIPYLGVPIAAPSAPAPDLLGSWRFDHREVAPGAQTTFPIGDKRQDAFTLTLQTIYTRGDPDGAHQELTPGVQFSAPLSTALSDGSVWTFNPFVQLTDVDRFGAVGGIFHYWQPYAQIGAQVSTGADVNPTITGNLFPINLGLDVGDSLTLTAGAGLTFGFNPLSGRGSLGPQFTFGANVKFGGPDKKDK